jgi:peptidoglycan/LPS O-acetylase OafA/YrhL
LITPGKGEVLPTVESKRIYSLDILRGVAVLLVLFRHMPLADATSPLLLMFGVGWAGVDLFFVLSGFLSGLLFTEFDKTGTIRPLRFWLRRGMKIWPSYFATYGLAMVVQAFATGHLYTLKIMWPNYVFIQNYFPTEFRWNHSWSIAIEEHFYLALPLVLLLYRGRLFTGLFKHGAVFCAVILAVRLTMLALGDSDWMHFYYPTHLRADSLCFGVMLGYLYQYQRQSFLSIGRHWVLLLGIAPIIVVLVAYLCPLETNPFSYTVGFTLLYLVFGGLVVAARSYPEFGKSTGLAAVAWTGVYSYTIYLAHSVVYALPGANTLRSAVVSAVGPLGDRALFFLLSIIGGVAISHLVERPFLRLRARWFPTMEVVQSGPSTA